MSAQLFVEGIKVEPNVFFDERTCVSRVHVEQRRSTPAKLISHLVFPAGRLFVRRPWRAEEAEGELKGGSNQIYLLSPTQFSTLACVRGAACVHALRRINPREASAECFHSYAKVAADYVFGYSWKRVSSILRSGSICPSTKEPLEHMRMGGSGFFCSFYSSF